MNRIKEVLIFAVGCAFGVGLAWLSPREALHRLAPSGVDARSATGSDQISASLAHAENPATSTVPDPASSARPLRSSTGLTPEIEAWLRTLPIDVLRRASSEVDDRLWKVIDGRFPRVKSADIERHDQALVSALLAHGNSPGFWIGDGSLTAGDKTYDLKFFFNFYNSNGGWEKPLDLTTLSKPAELCYLIEIIVPGLEGRNSTGSSSCAGGVSFARDRWMVTSQWRMDPIESFYTSFAVGIPPFETSGATFELLGAKDSKWTAGLSVSWRSVDREEFRAEQARLRTYDKPSDD
jgi:hypothetical protein